MNKIDIQYYKSKIGEFIIGSFDNSLCLMDYRYRKMRSSIDNRIKNGLKADYIENETDIIIQTINQIEEYLNGSRVLFEIPLLMIGSDFQKQVWNELLKIKYGELSSYLKIAKNIKNESAVRAVAAANGANAISIIIPCHRVIGSNGELVGYAGGLNVKKKLLDLEKSKISNEDLFGADSL